MVVRALNENGVEQDNHTCDLGIEMRYSQTGPRSKSQGHWSHQDTTAGIAAMKTPGQTPVIGPPGRITCWLCNRKCRQELDTLSAPANPREARVFKGTWQFGIEDGSAPSASFVARARARTKATV